ncbi:MAG TPA: EamA family transporter [Bradyrhizobium sp.]
MKPADIALALGVAVIWGLGFVFTRYAIDEISPTLLNLVRFSITALPCLLLPRPKLAWPVWIGISLLLVWQYLTQTWGIAHGVPAGLTAVVVQSQALFTIAFAALLLGERPTKVQLIGIGVATCGLLMICFTVGYDFTFFAFAVTMTAPISFAFTNLLLRRAREVPLLDLFAWVSLAALPPLAAASLLADGPAAIWGSVTHLSPGVMACLVALSVGSTTVGYWIWGRLLRNYTATEVVPFALLVPFVGSAASSIVFGERFGPLRLAGMITVIGGIAVMLLLRRPRALLEAV